MKILADENITDVARLFAPYGDVSLYSGRDIRPAQISDVDVLLVRSVTNINAQLLADSQVGFVGSATIGTDHVDLEYLRGRNIHFAHAPGCNANAVVQYMLAVLCSCIPQWRNKTVAIIGCGQVGGRLLRCLQGLGLRCKVYDPFLGAEDCAVLVSFAEAMRADIVCVHTPLTMDGSFPSYHMIDRTVLGKMRADTVLINAGRGAVIDNQALLELLYSNKSLRVVLDVWEHEPVIPVALLDKVLLGTPHIAGHSLEGKLRGTEMLLEAFCQWHHEVEPSSRRLSASKDEMLTSLLLDEESSLEKVVLETYHPVRDFEKMTEVLSACDSEPGQCFDALRRDYSLRREFSHFEVSGITDQQTRRDLEVLGFSQCV